jgi:hypothetical protein
LIDEQQVKKSASFIELDQLINEEFNEIRYTASPTSNVMKGEEKNITKVGENKLPNN